MPLEEHPLLQRLRLLRWLRSDYVIPRGWGVAWDDILRNGVWIAPVPLNLALGKFRRLWHWILWAHANVRPTKLEELWMLAYLRGHRDAEEGRDRRAVERLLREVREC